MRTFPIVKGGGKNENIDCSTQIYHLVEMEAWLENYKSVMFATTAANV